MAKYGPMQALESYRADNRSQAFARADPRAKVWTLISIAMVWLVLCETTVVSRLTGLRLSPFTSGRIVFTVAFSPKQPLSRLLSSLLFAYWSQRLLVIDYNVPRARAIELCVGTLLHCGLVYPRTIKFSLPSLYPRHHSRDKIFQAFPAFRTASDKSWVEAWERGYGPLVTLGVEAGWRPGNEAMVHL